jgi:hypothetical protein
VVRFNATTLWHIDAVEWAPSTASLAAAAAEICGVQRHFGSQNNSEGRLIFDAVQVCFQRFSSPTLLFCNSPWIFIDVSKYDAS